MRKSNLFRTLAAVTMLAVVTVSANAQVTTAGTANTPRNGTALTAACDEAVDFVTINSIMPYSVTPDANVAAMVDGSQFLASVYNWTLPAGGTVTAIGGGALTEPVPASGWFTDYDVEVHWNGTAAIRTLTVRERPRNTIGMPVCDGSDSTLSIYVMPEPTAIFIEAGTLANATNIEATAGDAVVGGCAIGGTTVHFNVTFTGTESFNIAYNYVFTPFGGAAAAPVPLTVNGLGAASFLTATPAAPNTDAVTDAFQFVVPSGAGTYGRYVFTLTSVTDRVSRKSFNGTNTGVLTNTVGSSPAGPTLTLISVPTPVTGTIRHVDNNTTAW